MIKTDSLNLKFYILNGNSLQNPLCSAFYTSLTHLKPFPKFPVELHVENGGKKNNGTDSSSVVCFNSTHGLYGWCGTLTPVSESLKGSQEGGMPLPTWKFSTGYLPLSMNAKMKAF